MSFRFPNWFLPLAVLATPFLVYLAFSITTSGAFAVGVMGDGYLNDHTVYTGNPAEARAAGVWLDTALVVPRHVRHTHYDLTFTSGYLYQLRTSHRPGWLQRRTETKVPRVVLTLTYRVRYRGPGQPNEQTGPTLYSPYSGGQCLAQAIAQERTLSVYTNLLADGSLDMGLPVALTLEASLQAPPLRLFAYPGRLWRTLAAPCRLPPSGLSN